MRKKYTNKEITEIDPFIIIDEKNGSRFYGGHQAWFMRKTMSFAGCGVVAAANALRALLCRHPELYDNLTGRLKLLGGVILTKAEYTSVINDMYKHMRVAEIPVLNVIYDKGKIEYGKKLFNLLPPSFGMSATAVIEGAMRYAKKRGLLLHCEHCSVAYINYMKGLDFIKRGLKENGAVILLTCFNKHPISVYNAKAGEITGKPSESFMKTHFAIITDIIYKEHTVLLKLSTWGKAATVDYDTLFDTWQKRRAYVSSLIYFVPAESPSVYRADIMKSLPFAIKSALQSAVGRRILKEP